jgi:hypothetical protein
MTDPKDDLASAEQWRDAVLDAMVCWEMWPQPGETPKQALNRLLVLEQQVALDPAVSTSAVELIEQGRREARADAQPHSYVEHVRDNIGFRPFWMDLPIIALGLLGVGMFLYGAVRMLTE